MPDCWGIPGVDSGASMSSWLSNFVESSRQLSHWSAGLKSHTSIWLPGLLRPDALLSAMLLNASRRGSVPIESLCLRFEVTRKTPEEVTEPPRDGHYVHGLFLEGAKWDDRQSIMAPIERGDGVTPGTHSLADEFQASFMPVLHAHCEAGTNDHGSSEFLCPVFKTKSRLTKLKLVVPLKFLAGSQASWALAGAALLLEAPVLNSGVPTRT